MVVLPDQLILAVVDIRGGISAVADRQDVAVVVIGIGMGNIISRGTDPLAQQLPGGGGCAGGFKGVGLGIDLGRSVVGSAAGDAAIAVVGVGLAYISVGDGGDPVVVVIGIAGGSVVAVTSFAL